MTTEQFFCPYCFYPIVKMKIVRINLWSYRRHYICEKGCVIVGREKMNVPILPHEQPYSNETTIAYSERMEIEQIEREDDLRFAINEVRSDDHQTIPGMVNIYPFFP